MVRPHHWRIREWIAPEPDCHDGGGTSTHIASKCPGNEKVKPEIFCASWVQTVAKPICGRRKVLTQNWRMDGLKTKGLQRAKTVVIRIWRKPLDKDIRQ